MKHICLFIAALLLAACAQLGVPAADTFNKKALAAHQTVTAVAQSATTLRTAGKLSDADKANIVASLTAAEQAIDLATALSKTDATAGSTKLDSAVIALTALQSYLLARSK